MENGKEPLLMFMQSDIPASAEKRAAVKNLAATIKREIRNYNNRPAPDVHIICADYDGRLELVQLPDELDKAHKMDATSWFLNHHYLKSYNSPYDCTGQEFTSPFCHTPMAAIVPFSRGPSRLSVNTKRNSSSAGIVSGMPCWYAWLNMERSMRI